MSAMFYVIAHGHGVYGDYLAGIFKTRQGAENFAEQAKYQEQTGNYVVEAESPGGALKKALGKYTD